MQKTIPTESMQPLSHFFEKDNAGKIYHVITTTDIEHARAAMVAPQLLAALKQYVVEQGRLLDNYSESDMTRRAQLWHNLHVCEGPAREALAKAEGTL